MMRASVLAGAVLALAHPGSAGAIIGGELVPPGAYPAVGVITGPAQPPSVLRCTGTLVAPDWVLSAGHCNQLALGVFTLDPATAEGGGGEPHQIDGLVQEPGYVAYNGDALLFHLSKPSDVAPMQIAGPGERDLWPAGAPATLLGYGAEDENLKVPAGLKRTGATIIPDADCEAAYPRTGGLRVADTARDLCASLGDAVGGPGDSGGPLLVTAPDGRVRIAGVTSGYNDPNLSPAPLMLGRVAGDFMRPWLAANVPGAIGAPPSPLESQPQPAAFAPRLSLRRLPGRRLRLRVTGAGVAAVRFAVAGRRAVVDRRAPFRRVVRLGSTVVRVRASVTATDGRTKRLSRRTGRR